MYVNPASITMHSHEHIQSIENFVLQSILCHEFQNYDCSTITNIFDSSLWIQTRLQILWKEQRKQRKLVNQYINSKIYHEYNNTIIPPSNFQHLYDNILQSSYFILQPQFPLAFVPDIVLDIPSNSNNTAATTPQNITSRRNSNNNKQQYYPRYSFSKSSARSSFSYSHPFRPDDGIVPNTNPPPNVANHVKNLMKDFDSVSPSTYTPSLSPVPEVHIDTSSFNWSV